VGTVAAITGEGRYQYMSGAREDGGLRRREEGRKRDRR
jgi:hypothetical protein